MNFEYNENNSVTTDLAPQIVVKGVNPASIDQSNHRNHSSLHPNDTSNKLKRLNSNSPGQNNSINNGHSNSIQFNTNLDKNSQTKSNENSQTKSKENSINHNETKTPPQKSLKTLTASTTNSTSQDTTFQLKSIINNPKNTKQNHLDLNRAIKVNRPKPTKSDSEWSKPINIQRKPRQNGNINHPHRLFNQREPSNNQKSYRAPYHKNRNRDKPHNQGRYPIDQQRKTYRTMSNTRVNSSSNEGNHGNNNNNNRGNNNNNNRGNNDNNNNNRDGYNGGNGGNNNNGNNNRNPPNTPNNNNNNPNNNYNNYNTTPPPKKNKKNKKLNVKIAQKNNNPSRNTMPRDFEQSSVSQMQYTSTGNNYAEMKVDYNAPGYASQQNFYVANRDTLRLSRPPQSVYGRQRSYRNNNYLMSRVNNPAKRLSPNISINLSKNHKKSSIRINPEIGGSPAIRSHYARNRLNEMPRRYFAGPEQYVPNKQTTSSIKPDYVNPAYPHNSLQPPLRRNYYRNVSYVVSRKTNPISIVKPASMPNFGVKSDYGQMNIITEQSDKEILRGIQNENAVNKNLKNMTISNNPAVNLKNMTISNNPAVNLKITPPLAELDYGSNLVAHAKDVKLGIMALNLGANEYVPKSKKQLETIPQTETKSEEKPSIKTNPEELVAKKDLSEEELEIKEREEMEKIKKELKKDAEYTIKKFLEGHGTTIEQYIKDSSKKDELRKKFPDEAKSIDLLSKLLENNDGIHEKFFNLVNIRMYNMTIKRLEKSMNRSNAPNPREANENIIKQHDKAMYNPNIAPYRTQISNYNRQSTILPKKQQIQYIPNLQMQPQIETKNPVARYKYSPDQNVVQRQMHINKVNELFFGSSDRKKSGNKPLVDKPLPLSFKKESVPVSEKINKEIVIGDKTMKELAIDVSKEIDEIEYYSVKKPAEMKIKPDPEREIKVKIIEKNIYTINELYDIRKNATKNFEKVFGDCAKEKLDSDTKKSLFSGKLIGVKNVDKTWIGIKGDSQRRQNRMNKPTGKRNLEGGQYNTRSFGNNRFNQQRKFYSRQSSIAPQANIKKPTIFKTEDELEKVEKKFNGYLNKLSEENLDKIFNKFIATIKESDPKNKKIYEILIRAIFNKAVNEQRYSDLYAQLTLKFDSKFKGHKIVDVENNNKIGALNMKQLIINHVKATYKDTSVKSKDEKISLQLQSKIKEKSLGNIKFAGELCLNNLLSAGILTKCIIRLLSNKPSEKNFEVVCKLLRTIGNLLDVSEDKAVKRNVRTIYSMIQKHIDTIEGSRVKFLLTDIVTLHNNKWKSVDSTSVNQKSTIRRNKFGRPHTFSADNKWNIGKKTAAENITAPRKKIFGLGMNQINSDDLDWDNSKDASYNLKIFFNKVSDPDFSKLTKFAKVFSGENRGGEEVKKAFGDLFKVVIDSYFSKKFQRRENVLNKILVAASSSSVINRGSVSAAVDNVLPDLEEWLYDLPKLPEGIARAHFELTNAGVIEVGYLANKERAEKTGIIGLKIVKSLFKLYEEKGSSDKVAVAFENSLSFFDQSDQEELMRELQEKVKAGLSRKKV